MCPCNRSGTFIRSFGTLSFLTIQSPAIGSIETMIHDKLNLSKFSCQPFSDSFSIFSRVHSVAVNFFTAKARRLFYVCTRFSDTLHCRSSSWVPVGLWQYASLSSANQHKWPANREIWAVQTWFVTVAVREHLNQRHPHLQKKNPLNSLQTLTAR